MQTSWQAAALLAIGATILPSVADAAPPMDPTEDPVSSQAERAEAPAGADAEDVGGKSIGARFRYVVIPKFVLNLFADGGASIDAPMFGLEYASRAGSFEVVFSAMYGAYSMPQTPLKSKGEIIEGWEFVTVDMKALYFTSSFLWSAPFSKSDPTFQFLYGAETGLGLMFGHIFHAQAMPANPKSTLPPTEAPWVPCPGVGAHPYCGDENEHFGNYDEPSWFNGGAKPVVLPWLSLNTGILVRPSPKFSARLDLGYNLFNGPFVGVAGDFGI